MKFEIKRGSSPAGVVEAGYMCSFGNTTQFYTTSDTKVKTDLFGRRKVVQHGISELVASYDHERDILIRKIE